MRTISVAIPVLDGGPLLGEVLRAVAAQDGGGPDEVVVVDSGSSDGSVAVAQAAGARVIEQPRSAFGHGRTRNLLVEQTAGDVVVFLTQDAVPADRGWLRALDAAFDAGPKVALACGPYRPVPGASVAVRRELEAFFAEPAGAGRAAGRQTAIGPTADGPPTAASTATSSTADAPEVRVFGPADVPAPLRPSPATFHTDANGALLRAAWEQTPFRDVAYAEDQILALDLLRAGWSRAFVPAAAVLHSHDYPPGERLRRYFDEFRALHEVYGIRTRARPRAVLGAVRAEVRGDRAWARAHAVADVDGATLHSLGHHLERTLGAAAGTRADRLPRTIRRRLSRDGLA